MTWAWLLVELDWEHWRVVGVYATKALARASLAWEDARVDRSGFKRGYSYNIERHRFRTDATKTTSKGNEAK